MTNEGYLLLPVQVAGRVDVGRLLHEAEQIDNFLKQSAIREPGTPMKVPKTSRLMDEFLSSNKLNLLQGPDRARILNFLIMVKAKAPILHMSFGVDPSPSFTQRLMGWLRKEIHPLVLVQIGLQPNIGAGCVVRTTNKYFDFSLREHFKKQRPLLISGLQGKAQSEPAQPSVSVAEAPSALPDPAPQPHQATAPPAPAEQQAQQQLATAEAELKQQVESALTAMNPTAHPAPHRPASPHPVQKVEVDHE